MTNMRDEVDHVWERRSSTELHCTRHDFVFTLSIPFTLPWSPSSQASTCIGCPHCIWEQIYRPSACPRPADVIVPDYWRATDGGMTCEWHRESFAADAMCVRCACDDGLVDVPRLVVNGTKCAVEQVGRAV